MRWTEHHQAEKKQNKKQANQQANIQTKHNKQTNQQSYKTKQRPKRLVETAREMPGHPNVSQNFEYTVLNRTVLDNYILMMCNDFTCNNALNQNEIDAQFWISKYLFHVEGQCCLLKEFAHIKNIERLGGRQGRNCICTNMIIIWTVKQVVFGCLYLKLFYIFMDSNCSQVRVSIIIFF